MAVDNFARALAAKALEGSIGSVTPEDLEKKYDKTGGTISGDVSIQGNLTVSGTTTTEKEKQLLVEENVIATNANKVDLKTLLSGLAINKNASATYGIMYDPADDSVKLGLGTLDAEKKFTFNDSGTDGKAIATRADSSELTDGDLVKWDGITNSLVDSGKKTDDFVEKVTVTEGSNLAYIAKNDGTQSTVPIAQMPYQNTVAQRGVGGTLKVGTAVADSDAMPKKQVEDGFVAKVTTGNRNQAYTVDTNNQQTMMGIDEGATAWALARRYTDGRLQVGTPIDVADATTKKYVDDGFVAKVTTKNIAYTTNNDGVANTTHVSFNPDAWNLATFDGFACLRTSDPTGDDGRQCVNKQFADETYVAKITEPYRVYATDGLGNLKTNAGYASRPITDGFVVYDGKGCLRTNGPLVGAEDYDRQCVNIGYANNNYVSKIGTGTQAGNILYGRDASNNEKGFIVESIAHNASTIVQRKSGGAVEVGTAVEDSDAMPKKQVEDGFVKKVNAAGIEAYTAVGNKTVMIVVRDDASEWSIPRRDGLGNINVGTPIDASHATPKAYVDNLNTITITAGA